MSDKYRYEVEDRPCEPRCSNEDAEDWCDIADWEESRGDYYAQECHNLKVKISQLEQELERANEAKKQALAFLVQIPLYTEDEHVLHYVGMTQSWIEALTKGEKK